MDKTAPLTLYPALIAAPLFKGSLLCLTENCSEQHKKNGPTHNPNAVIKLICRFYTSGFVQMI